MKFGCRLGRPLGGPKFEATGGLVIVSSDR